MIYGYARVSTGEQSVEAQVRQLAKAGCAKVFREVASGAKTDRAQLRMALDRLEVGDVLMVTRLDRLARSTRNLLNTLAAITGKKAGFRSLGDAWADTTTAHGRLILIVRGASPSSSASSFARAPARGGLRPWPGAKDGPAIEAHLAPASRGDQATREGRDAGRDWSQLQRQRGDDIPTLPVTPGSWTLHILS